MSVHVETRINVDSATFIITASHLTSIFIFIISFLQVLVNGENHVKEIPIDRWKNEAFFSENKDDPGKSYVKHAGLLKR